MLDYDMTKSDEIYTIMIIDDDSFNLLAIEKILTKLCKNINLLLYENGLDSLEYLKQMI
jgi:response regulator RpfG family c-di-GMP phosphodiesterase